MSRRRVLLPVLFIFAVVSCDSDEETRTSPLVPPNFDTQPTQVEGDGGIVDLLRVGVSLDAEGSFEPDQPITLTVNATARWGASSANVRLIAPEVEAGRLTEFGDGFRMPIGVPFASLAEWQFGAMSAGDRTSRSVELVVPRPGYYQITVRIESEPASHAYEDPFVMEKQVIKKWLLVTEEGGTITDSFERARLPDGALKSPGPFRGFPPGDEQPPREASFLETLLSAIRALVSSSHEVDMVALYEDNTGFSAEMLPAEGVTAISKLYWQDIRDENYTGTRVDNVIGPDGHFSLDCPSSGYLWYTQLQGYDSEVLDLRRHSGVEAYNWHCGDTLETRYGEGSYHVYTGMSDMIPIIDTHLDHSRSRAEFRVTTYGCGDSSDPYTCYRRSEDRIYFTASRSVGGDVKWVSAHEYGHALHHKSLGGLWNASNCNPHYIDSVSSYKCAHKEGFADYVGGYGATQIGAFPVRDWETYDRGESGDSDGKIEGHVAATFWDLTDGDVDGTDSTNYRGSYVANVFRTCRTEHNSGGWHSMKSIEQYLWCLENRIDSKLQQDVFPNTPWWVDWDESAMKPAGWDSVDIRNTWRQNLKGN